MKLYSKDIKKVETLIKQKKLRAILFYGPNYGLAQKCMHDLQRNLNYKQKNISAKGLSAQNLDMLCESSNFFAKPELIAIETSGTGITADFKKLLSQDGVFLNLPCFYANDNLPASGIRKFFEQEANLASIACYYEEAQGLLSRIKSIVNAWGKEIDQDAVQYMCYVLEGDSQNIDNELQKLHSYIGPLQKRVTLEDVMQIITRYNLASGDEMCIYFANRLWKKFLRETGRISQQGIHEVLMIRALVRFYQNLYFCQLQMSEGINIDNAMRICSPPIFFKYAEQFKQILRKISTEEIIHVLNNLLNAETKIKSSSVLQFSFHELITNIEVPND